MSGAFRWKFDREPRWIARAPGRVNLIGEHTDYNDGFVLPMAIERETTVTAARNGSRRIRLHSATLNARAEIDLDRGLQPLPLGAWANYALGVIAGFAGAGARIEGFDALVETTVPVGSGLSSSAAFEVALATLLEGVTGTRLDPRDKAALCRRAEHDYAGVPCGLMDQTVSVLGREGHLVLLDCGSGRVDWIEFADPAVAVLIIDTRVRHSLAAGEYGRRRAECEAAAAKLGVGILCTATLDRLESVRANMEPLLYRRARHVLGEQGRTRGAVDAIRARKWAELGRAMYASHASLRDDFEVSCAELDAVVDAARAVGLEGGVYGCRMTGGGFGGCAVAVVDAPRADAIAVRIVSAVRSAGLQEPTTFVTRAAQGATLLDLQGR